MALPSLDPTRPGRKRITKERKKELCRGPQQGWPSAVWWRQCLVTPAAGSEGVNPPPLLSSLPHVTTKSNQEPEGGRASCCPGSRPPGSPCSVPPSLKSQPSPGNGHAPCTAGASLTKASSWIPHGVHSERCLTPSTADYIFDKSTVASLAGTPYLSSCTTFFLLPAWQITQKWTKTAHQELIW